MKCVPCKEGEEIKCVLCEEKVGVQDNGWDKGHNADPVSEGRCCTDCNYSVVIPARLIVDLERRY